MNAILNQTELCYSMSKNYTKYQLNTSYKKYLRRDCRKMIPAHPDTLHKIIVIYRLYARQHMLRVIIFLGARWANRKKNA